MYQPFFPLETSVRDGKFALISDLKDSIKQNVVILLNTSPGEWPGDPNLGVGVRSFLFENSVSPEWRRLKKRIQKQFAEYLPFLEIEADILTEDQHGNALSDYYYAKLIIRYSIDSLTIADTLTFSISETANLQEI